MLCAWRQVNSDVLLDDLCHFSLADAQNLRKSVSMYSKIINVYAAWSQCFINFVNYLVREHIHNISLLVNFNV